MITLVTDAEGNVLHDCAAAGCAVSWDGEVIDAHSYARATAASADAAASPAAPPAAPAASDIAPVPSLAAGDTVPGAQPVDETRWHVAGNTATLREDTDA